MQEELISVIIPTYNRRDTILDCINSVLKQTYKNIEVIVVDDGSSDNTNELFKDNLIDERVKFYRYTPNKGACYARNYGVSLSRGKYIAFQDSDDKWKSNKLERELYFLKKYDFDFVFCGMNRINPLTKESYFYPIDTFDPNKNSVEQFLIENTASTQTFLLKREVMNLVKFDVTFKRYQDWDFVLQIAINNFNIGYLKESLVDSVIQVNSISTTVKSGKAYEHLLKKYESYFTKYPKASASIYNKLGMSFKKIDRNKTKYYLKKSLSYQFNFKIFIKYILFLFHLWK